MDIKMKKIQKKKQKNQKKTKKNKKKTKKIFLTPPGGKKINICYRPKLAL